MPERLLVIGATGLLGPYLVDAGRTLGVVQGVARHTAELRCDITSKDDVRSAIRCFSPTVVILAAALSDVDACETHPALAHAINVEGVANVVSEVPPEARLVLISTDQAYADTPGPHGEISAAPVNVYGRTKIGGETEALRHPHSLALRCNFFGPSRTSGHESLSDFFERRLRAGESISAFRDVWFSPLHMTTFAATLVDAIRTGAEGIYNVGSNGGASKHEFCLMIASHLGLDASKVAAVDAASLAGRARRPRDMRLDVRKLETALGRSMPTLEEEVSKL